MRTLGGRSLDRFILIAESLFPFYSPTPPTFCPCPPPVPRIQWSCQWGNLPECLPAFDGEVFTFAFTHIHVAKEQLLNQHRQRNNRKSQEQEKVLNRVFILELEHVGSGSDSSVWESPDKMQTPSSSWISCEPQVHLEQKYTPNLHMRYIYIENCLVVYRKLKFHWVFCIFIC